MLSHDAVTHHSRRRRAPMSLSRIARAIVTGLLTMLVLTGPVLAQAPTPWVAPPAEKAKKNPLANDKKAIEQGEKVAKINCVSCHGAGGKGDGAAAVALNP